MGVNIEGEQACGAPDGPEEVSPLLLLLLLSRRRECSVRRGDVGGTLGVRVTPEEETLNCIQANARLLDLSVLDGGW